MEKDNLIEQIKKAEKKANEAFQKSQQENNRKISLVKTEKESELANLRQKFDHEIKKIMAETDKKIGIIQTKIQKETEEELNKLRNIPPDKKRKAAGLVIDALIKN